MVRKKGFSLVESLISMAVLAVIGVMFVPVFTAKKKPKAVEFEHGSFVCIKTSSGHYQRYNNENF